MLLASVRAASGAPAALLLVVLPAVPTAPPVAWWRGGVVEASVLLLLVVQQGRQQHLLLHAPRPHERTWWAAWVTTRATATAGRPFATGGDTSWPMAGAKVSLVAGGTAERGWCS